MPFPSGLVQRVRSGHTVLVAGLGFGEATGWEGIVRRLAARFAAEGEEAQTATRAILDLAARGRSRAALAWLRQRLPDRALAEVLAEAQPRNAAVPVAVAVAATLPWRAIVTTAFDDAWERALPAQGFRRLDARALIDAREEDGASPFLLHALGTPEVPESLCVSAADLHRRAGPGAVGALLRAVYAERSFVFVGFRPDDPDLALLVDGMLGAASTSAEHFLVFTHEDAVAGETNVPAEALGAALDLTPVPFVGSLEEVLRSWGGSEAGRTAPGPTTPPVITDAGAAELLARGDHAEWVRSQRALCDAAPPAERAPLYEQMGDVYRERLGSPVQAISCYRSALQHEPARRSVLAKLAELYAAHKHWRAAEESLVKLAHTEPAAERRARFFCRAAAIANEELDNPARAAQLLDRALEDVPDMPEAFEALERLLVQEKNWQALARLYQRTVRELGADGRGNALRLRAATGMAELGLRFSKDPKLALRALEVAEGLDPGNLERKALMAGLYGQAGPGFEDKAIAMHHALLSLDPDRLASFRTLADLYRATGDRDRLWCVAATLTFLRKADDELRDVFERGKATRVGPPAGRLSPECWARLAHPDEDATIGAVLALLAPALLARHAETPAALGLQPEDRVDVTWDDRPATRALLTASRWLDLPAPGLFVRLTDRRAAVLARLQVEGDPVPALLVGAPVLTKPDLAEVTFQVARALVLLRPEKAVCALEGAPGIVAQAIDAALLLAGVRAAPAERRAEIEELAVALEERLAPAAREALTGAARALALRHGEQGIDGARFCAGVELTCARVAFALVNDLGTAARALAAEGNSPHGPTAKQRLKDLVSFSVSPAYFETRQALGLAK